MSTEILERELHSFGLSPSEVKVYDFLLRNGKSGISEISRNLKVARTNVYSIVKSLMSKGFLESTFTNPLRVHAVPLGKTLDMLIIQRQTLLSREVESLEKIKENIIAKYQNIEGEEEKAEPGRFQILREDSIYSKLLMSLNNISNNLYVYMSKRNFVKLYNTDFLGKLIKCLKKRSIRVVFLVDKSLENIDLKGVDAEVKFIEPYMNDFIVFDDKEVFYYLDPQGRGEEDTVLWATLPSLVTIFRNMFEMERKTHSVAAEEMHKIEYQNFLFAKKVAKKLFSSLSDGCEGNVITGASGCKHEFDMLLRLNSKITAVDFISSKQPINTLQVLPFYVKTYDLSGLVTNFVLLLDGEIDQEAEVFLKDHKIDLEVLQEA